jgi:hypothetical protein
MAAVGLLSSNFKGEGNPKEKIYILIDLTI